MAAVATGRCTSRELVERHLDRIGRLNPGLNAIVTLDAEGARAQARACDDAVRVGAPLGPLHGVPITVKELFDVAGLRVTYGFKPLAARVAERDATAVARLRAAGAVVLGLTNTPELGFDWQCVSPVHGRTDNPWSAAHSPGGSSGGSATAVAAGLSALDVGSDACGSIRLPAAWCGTYALKPTEHRVPHTGHGEVPGAPRALRHIVTFGPLARTLDDCALAFGLLAGPDGLDGDVPPVPVAATPRREAATLRVAWTRGLAGAPLAREVGAAVEHAAERLAAAGATVEEWPADVVDALAALEAWGFVAGSEIASAVPSGVRSAWAAVTRWRLGPGPLTSALFRAVRASTRVLEDGLMRRDALRRALDARLATVDAWLLPAASTPAIRHQASGRPVPVDGRPHPYAVACAGHVAPFALSGHPVVVLPVAWTADGLPIGVQCVGRRWEEPALLAAARAIDAVAGAPRPPLP